MGGGESPEDYANYAVGPDGLGRLGLRADQALGFAQGLFCFI